MAQPQVNPGSLGCLSKSQDAFVQRQEVRSSGLTDHNGCWRVTLSAVKKSQDKTSQTETLCLTVYLD